MTIIAQIRRLVPDARIYVSALNGFVPPHVCEETGADGPSLMAALARRLVSEGLARRGPNVGELLSIYQTPSNRATSENSQTTVDGCHPNEAGQAYLGRTLMAFPAFSEG